MVVIRGGGRKWYLSGEGAKMVVIRGGGKAGTLQWRGEYDGHQ